MKQQYRIELSNITKELTALRRKLEAVYEYEKEAYANMPEGMQDSERGEMMCEYLGEIEDDISNLGEIEEKLNDIAKR